MYTESESESEATGGWNTLMMSKRQNGSAQSLIFIYGYIVKMNMPQGYS